MYYFTFRVYISFFQSCFSLYYLVAFFSGWLLVCFSKKNNTQQVTYHCVSQIPPTTSQPPHNWILIYLRLRFFPHLLVFFNRYLPQLMRQHPLVDCCFDVFFRPHDSLWDGGCLPGLSARPPNQKIWSGLQGVTLTPPFAPPWHPHVNIH